MTKPKKTIIESVTTGIEVEKSTADINIAGIESKTEVPAETAVTPITKPSAFNLDKFKSKRAAALANVETLLTALPIHSIAQAKDFVRLHPDEINYWSDELCFVNVPIKGQKRDTLHLIDEDLGMRFLPPARIQRFRLALATKPHDVFFLCQVPTRNTDNPWNETNLQACEQAKMLWVQATSRKEENIEKYQVTLARDADAFPELKWALRLHEAAPGWECRSADVRFWG